MELDNGTDWTNKVPPPPPVTKPRPLATRDQVEAQTRMMQEFDIMRGRLAELEQQVRVLGDVIAELKKPKK